MALDVMSMIARLGIDKSEYEKGMKDAETGFKNFGSNLKKGVQNVAKIAAGAAAAGAAAFGAVTAAVVKGTGEVAAFGDNIDKASQKLGISAKAYQEWDAVLQHSGTSIDSMGIGMKTLATKAAEGSDAFKALGISQKEAARMSREDLFARTITALQGVQNANQRAQLAQELFGKSAMELGPLLNTSAKDTQAMKDRVNELGGVLSDEAVKASAAYQDSLQDMTTAMDGMKRGLFASFLPSLTSVMDGITEIFAGGKGKAQITRGVRQLIDTMSTELPRLLRNGLKIGTAVGRAVISAIPETVRRIRTAAGNLFNNLKNLLLTNGVQKLSVFLNQFITGGTDKAFGPAQRSIQYRLTALFENIIALGRKIADKAAELWTGTIQPILQDLVSFLVDKVLPVVNTVISFITDNLDTIVPILSGVMAAIAGFAIAKKITNLMGVVKGFFEVIKANPFGIILTAIAALVGYLVHLYQTNEEARDKINAAFEAIKGFWENTLKPAFQEIYTYVVETLIPALIEWWDTKLKPTIENVFAAIAGFWNDTLKPALAALYDYVVADLIPTLIVWWEDKLKPTVEAVFTAIAGFWENTLKPAFQDIYTYVTETLIPTLKEKWEAIQPVFEAVFTAIKTFWEETAQPALKSFVAFVTDIVVPAMGDIGDKVKYIWDTYLRPIAAWLGETFVKAWEGVSTFVTETLLPVFQDIGDKVQYVWDTYLKPVADWLTDTFVIAWDGLKTQMQNIIDFITGVFSGDWSKAWDALVAMVSTPFNTLGEILKTPINAVINLLNSMIGKVEDAINKVVDGINNHLRIDVDFGRMPDWLGGGSLGGIHWGANLARVDWGRIKTLANGGTLRPGENAIVGEYAPELLRMIGNQAVVTPLNTGRFPGGGQEVVVPRNDNRQLTVIFEIDRQQAGKMVYKLNNEETQRVGVKLSKGVAY